MKVVVTQGDTVVTFDTQPQDIVTIRLADEVAFIDIDNIVNNDSEDEDDDDEDNGGDDPIEPLPQFPSRTLTPSPN